MLFPPIQIPEIITRFSEVQVQQKKRAFLDICQIIENDKFLFLYLHETFKEHIGKGGIMTLLNSLGWEGVRNRIAEAYLYKAEYGKYPQSIELDLVQNVLDFEKRFDFLFPQGNMRVFMMGFLLKLANINAVDNLLVPLDVDEILSSFDNRSNLPDWLIMSVWSLVKIKGFNEAHRILQENKGIWPRIKKELSEDEATTLAEHMLWYSQAIGDQSFFILERV